MDRAKYRGFRTDGKGWVYGCLTVKNKIPFISISFRISKYYQNMSYSEVEVISKTVGQFTGKKDKNGKEIYDGDKFKPDTSNDEVKSVVRWDNEFAKFVVDSYGYNYHIGEGSQEVYENELSICDTIDLGDMILEYCEVVGNIHEKGAEE